MWRLNVRPSQIDECIQKSMYAIGRKPQNPELRRDDLLLLQLVKGEAVKLGKAHSRVDFALVFDHLEHDYDGSISRHHWPDADKTWRWILHCSASVPTIPFSMEDLSLSDDKSYQGESNPRYIRPKDQKNISPYIQWNLAEIPAPSQQLVPVSQVAEKFGWERALGAIYNHDRIALKHPARTRDVTVSQFNRNPWLAESLKVYYSYRCQICGEDFQDKYGVPLVETHHIHYLSKGGLDVSQNIAVLCPNHHRIIHATDAHFNRENLSYDYPNGLSEKLMAADHFVQAPPFALR